MHLNKSIIIINHILLIMENSKAILDQIKLKSQNYPAGILPPGKSLDSLIGHTVINISDIDLTTPQIEALQKGLTFCPTPGSPKKSLIWNDFQAFHRRLVLQHHFYNDNNILDSEDRELVNMLAENLDGETNPYQNIHAKFKPKSNWLPNNTHISLKSFKLAFKNNLLYSKPTKSKYNNLTKKQRAGIQELTNNPELTIKKADKGSAVVVMNTKDYFRVGYRQVLDQKFYTRIDSHPTKEVSDRITQKLIQMRSKGLISEQNLNYLQPKNCKHGQFYLLPKIHKKGIPGRPICSLVNHPTANISKFVDEHIKRYVPHKKSYIRDTQDFISKIISLGKIPEGAIIATLDVTSLYTNIPNHEGILAVADHLRKDPSKGPIASYILDLLNWYYTTCISNSMMNSFYKLGGQQWEQHWHQIMPTYSWIGLKLRHYPISH